MDQPSIFTIKKFHRRGESQMRTTIQNSYTQEKTHRLSQHGNKDKKHKPLHLISLQSRALINAIDLKDNVSKFVFKGKLQQKTTIEEPKSTRYLCDNRSEEKKQIRLTRYVLEDMRKNGTLEPEDEQEIKYQKTKQQVGMLRKIIDHYKIKSLQRTYYSNLVNNLGIKVSNGSDSNHYITVKGNLKNSRSKGGNSTLYQPSFQIKNLEKLEQIDIDYMFRPPKIKAQSISKFLKSGTLNNTIDESKILNSTTINGQNTQSKKECSYNNSSKKDLINKSALLQTLQTCVTQKVNKYKQFLFIINFNHGVYRDLDVLKYEKPFKIFIGRGNNSNLIRSLIKKRFWFQETKAKNEAHFVWTQLKEQSIFKLQRSQDTDENPEYLLDEEETRKKQNKKRKQTKSSLTYLHETSLALNSNIQSTQLKHEIKPKRQNSLRSKFKTFDTNQPHSKLCTKVQTQSYNQITERFTYKKKSLFSERLKYMNNVKVIKQDQLFEGVIHNHLPVNGLLGNKKAMFYMLRQYFKLTNRNIFDCVPLTYHIKKGITDPQYIQFTQTYTQTKKNNRPSYWIIKPGEFSNRGQGITCTDKIQDVKNRVQSLKRLGKNKSLIVQQYIVNPMLYNGRKFDIRTFMLISTNNGVLRAYWYQQGYVRTSSYTWKLQEITDPLVHLTNDAIQKNCDDYGKFEPGNKLTYSQLQRYLDGLPRPNSKKSKFNFMTEIYPKIRQVAVDAVKATFNFLDKDRKGSNFELFGFDFMIDSDFKPWLIQINTNPCLELNCPILERIIPSVVQNTLRIGLDPIFPPPLSYSSTYKYNIPENALFYNKFELIFDEERDGPLLLRLYQDNNIMQRMEDYEEDKELYEEEGQQIAVQ